MDTDDISMELHKAIIVEAEKFNSDLALQFRLLASSCSNEEEYITEAKSLIREIREMEDSGLEELFFGSTPIKAKLLAKLDKMELNISKVEMIPESMRHFDF